MYSRDLKMSSYWLGLNIPRAAQGHLSYKENVKVREFLHIYICCQRSFSLMHTSFSDLGPYSRSLESLKFQLCFPVSMQVTGHLLCLLLLLLHCFCPWWLISTSVLAQIQSASLCRLISVYQVLPSSLSLLQSVSCVICGAKLYLE